MERVLIAVDAKNVCRKFVVQRVFVAVVAKVANLIRDYLLSDKKTLVEVVARV